MKLFKIVVIMLFITLTSCINKKENKTSVQKVAQVSVDSNGLTLLQQKCYACHSITSKSHDDIIAPPMVAVKRRYQMSFASEEEFVTALTNWVLDPKKENALMRGAVQNFNVMPKQPFNKDEIIEIAKYMYHNTLETPEWFETHFKEEHPNGMGKGMGNGSRKNKLNN